MCGIHGFIDAKLSKTEGQHIIERMVASTTHRGPDSSDNWNTDAVFLGHNRLSILDLTPNGNQPMTAHELTIAFNGEIYNYKEIKAELIQIGYEFKTETDTEVILKSYKEWGAEMLQKFLGMWSFSIWDNQKKELFCARDRFGIKPFYYLEKEGAFYFASEIKSLKNSRLFSKNLNLNQVSRFLQLGWLEYQNETMFSEVKTIEPGHYMVVKNGDIKIINYWNLDGIQEEDVSFVDAEKQFKELFDSSLDLHLRSDVPITATLSGGIDSSTIVASYLTNYTDKKIDAYSIYYSGKNKVDERPFVEELSKKYQDRLRTHYYSPDDENIKEEILKIMYHSDYPLIGSSPISQYFIMQEIKKDGFKVVLSGQGADDYLAGYMHSYYRHYADLLTSFRLLKFLKEFRIHCKNQNLGIVEGLKVAVKSVLSVFLDENKLYNLEYKRNLPFVMKNVESNAVSLDVSGENRLSIFHKNLISTTSIPALLHYEDRNSMAASIESRVPFLDHRLVEFSMRLKAEHKIHLGMSKSVLRNSMKDVLPEKIKNRTDKKGFVTPGETFWLRGCLKDLLELDYELLPFLDKEKCEKEIAKFRNGSNKAQNLIWRLSSLNLWMKNMS